MKNGGEGKTSPSFLGVKLYIGIPTRGTCSFQFNRSLIATMSALTAAGIDAEVHYCKMSCHIDMSRNTIVSLFMNSDCTHLLFIDDDMGWEPASVFNLLRQDIDFVAGVGPKKVDSGDEFCCHLNTDAEGYPIMAGELMSASDVGAAFVLLKRAAIERMIEAYPDLRCLAVDMKYGYHFYETIYTQTTFRSEDFTFCKRYTAAGGKVMIYPDISFLHCGDKDYTGNYHQFMLKGKPEAVQQDDDYKKRAHYSIVIVAYKAIDSLNRCLESLYNHPPMANTELIIIDNSPEPVGITEELWERLKTKYYCRYRKHENIGFAAGCNAGADLSTGRYLVFMNPDTVVYGGGWEMRLQAKFSDDKVGAVGPLSNFVCGLQNIITFDHSAKFARDGDVKHWEEAARAISNCGIAAGVETSLLIGFFIMIKREVWAAVGAFDPGFVLGCDDLDYSMRLKDAGYKLMVSPNVFVYHEGHKSFEEGGRVASDMHLTSKAYMRKKLADKYGDNIPTSTEIWGCEIFPTNVEEMVGKTINNENQ